MRLIRQTLSITDNSEALPLKITSLEDRTPELKRSGAYLLVITPKEIDIAISDSRGLFYAAQTLQQLAQTDGQGNTTLPFGVIKDYPDVAYRGTVEGFYGDPWSHTDRIEQLRFYGKMKMNTYIYGPKDDPYHSSPNWRKPYPEKEAAQIKDLVKEAAANCIQQAMGVAAEAPAEAPAAEVQSGFPACEENLGGAAAAGQGEVAFVADPIADSEITDTVNVDVLVCGQGPAGMAAALACAEQGLKTVAVEKGASPTWRSATMGAFHDRVHKKFGVEFDTKQWLDDAMVNCSYRGEQTIYQKWINTCDEAVDWFLDELEVPVENYFLTFNAGDFPEFTAAYDELSLSRSWNTSMNIPLSTDEISAKLQEKITAAGAEVLFNTPVVQLITEGEKVVGAIVKGENGYVKYLTAKGVVLATGGYEFNPEKLAACCRPRDLALGHWMNGTKTNTGDGHEMAKAIGALEDEYPHPLMLDPEQLMPYLRVNKRGVRFTAEYEAYNHLANAIQAQPGAYDYYIVDANVMDILESIWTPSSSCYGPKEVWAGAATSDNALKADTLEELAEKMGVPADAFVETINHWNEMCDAGEDTDFHFPGKMMHKIDTAPFYATKEMASALCTAGGLQITDKSEVLNTEAQPIEGLYAIGNVSGSMFSGTYPHNENCLSHSRCVTFGYNVAKTLAAL